MVDFDKDRDANLSAFERTGGAAHGGLTVRDYFAAKVMQSALRSIGSGVEFNGDDVAKFAYSMADDMMKERGKPTQSPVPTVEEAFGL